MHSSGSITSMFGPSRKASTGQKSTQSVCLHRMQASLTTNVMSSISREVVREQVLTESKDSSTMHLITFPAATEITTTRSSPHATCRLHRLLAASADVLRDVSGSPDHDRRPRGRPRTVEEPPDEDRQRPRAAWAGHDDARPWRRTAPGR